MLNKHRSFGCLLVALAILVACTPHVTPTPTIQPPTPRPTRAPTPTPVAAPIQTPAWFRDVVLYEIFPRSFYDSNGDGIGDLKGITAKLDYVQSLGVGAIWLTPIFASPSYHGYDTTDYYKINPDFGTEADLVELVREAHKRKMRVLLDYVAAHTSNQHPFFQDAYGNPSSKYSAWYQWVNAEHTLYLSFSSINEMPSLNHENPETERYLIDVASYWLKTGIDGYRCDYVLVVPHSFWKKLRAELKALNPDFLLLAEAWADADVIKTYYDDEFDATFDFPVYGAIEGHQDRVGDSLLIGAAQPALLNSLGLAQVAYPPGAQRAVFLNNHDTDRVMSEVKGDLRRAKLGATLLLTAPGTPMIYYGEEIGMSGVKAPAPDDDKARREPMDWYAAETGPGMTTWYKPADRNNKPDDGVSVEEERGKIGSLLEHYGALAALRNAHLVLRTGRWEKVAVENKTIFAYLRQNSTEAFLIVLNFGDAPASIAMDLGGTSLPGGAYQAMEVLLLQTYELNRLTLNLQTDAASGYVLQLVRH